MSKPQQAVMHGSESRFRAASSTAPVMIWMAGLDKKPVYFNQLWLDFTGLSENDLINGLVGIVHPDDYQQCHEIYCRGFDQQQPFRKECRLRRWDGEYRWMLDIGVPRFDGDGSFAGYAGACIDITEYKLAQEALADIGRRLIQAHEEERTRIGRELHDDIGQRLSLLAVGLDQLRERVPPELLYHVGELLIQTTTLTTDVNTMSHALHSTKIQMLGLVAAMKSVCHDFGQQHNMEIDFASDDFDSAFPAEVSLALFRILQEALRNASKHSGVKHVEVQLRETSGEVHLIVRDSGKGFDLDSATQGQGLGLTSMQERVRLLNGTFTIRSKPMGGTIIYARVPFKVEPLCKRVAG